MTEITAHIQTLEAKIDTLIAIVAKMSERQVEETYLTTEEACATFKISASTLFLRKREGRIDYWQDGRIVRWPKSGLQKIAKTRN